MKANQQLNKQVFIFASLALIIFECENTDAKELIGEKTCHHNRKFVAFILCDVSSKQIIFLHSID